MKYISLPKKFTVEEEVKDKKAKITIEPCFPGYGMTLGNTLRRVLLSSLSGGAVTAAKIKGAQHEFSAIKGVAEDVLQIILNLKQLRIKLHTDEPVTLKLKASGEKKATGADIEASSDAEIINKDLVIATLTDPSSKLEMDLTVSKGIGYVPSEEQGKGKGEIGVILVDSIFTPVINVGLEVSATRVGQKTDYDKIELNIETDGTISPEDAVMKSAEILTSQFAWIMGGGRDEVAEIDIEAPVPEIEKPQADEEESMMAEEEPLPIIESEGEKKTKRRGRPKKNEE